MLAAWHQNSEIQTPSTSRHLLTVRYIYRGIIFPYYGFRFAIAKLYNSLDSRLCDYISLQEENMGTTNIQGDCEAVRISYRLIPYQLALGHRGLK